MFNEEKKAMIVCCQHLLCIHNEGGKCKFEETSLLDGGVCEKAVDRMNLIYVKEFLEKTEKEEKTAKLYE